MSEADPQPDTSAAFDFLLKLRGSEPVVMTAIVPNNGGIESATFRPANDEAKIKQWIGARQRKANIYWTVNPTLKDLTGPGKKAGKADMRGMSLFHVDVDPRAGKELEEERVRAERALREFQPKPHIIIDSGNGFQGFWLLDEERQTDGSAEKAADLEGYNKQIALVLAADPACTNIDRVMRTPGTLNIPSAAKAKRGRKLTLAKLVEYNDAPKHPWSSFKTVASIKRSSPNERAAQACSITRKIALEELSNITDRCKLVIVHGRDPDEPNHFPSRSEALYYVCCELKRSGVKDDDILSVIMNPEFRISDSVLDKSQPQKYAERQVQRAADAAVGECFPARRMIMLIESELPRVLDESELALREADLPIYQTGGRMVHPVRLDESTDEDGIQREAGALVVRDLSTYRVREYLLQAADYRKPKDEDEGTYSVAPPLSIAKHILAREDRWRSRVLKAVVETPTLRSDGTILQQDGFDPVSGFLVDMRDVTFPSIPDRPSEDQARQALELFKKPLSEFPFELDDRGGGSASKSVALSAMLTALCRRGLRSAPLHAFSAPTMGTGKSLLADVVTILATGRPATVMSQGKSEEEEEKRLLSLLMQGDPILVIDNIERPIQGDAFASILTQGSWQSRLLGASKQVRVATNVLFLATGNNLAFRGDMATRAILCRLDANVERPETRRFRVDLKEQMPQWRPELVTAGLTVLRAFIAADRPGLCDLIPFGRFEDWSKCVRGALVWLGESDTCSTRTYIAERDSAREELADFIEGWKVAIGPGEVKSAREIISDAAFSDSPFKEAIEAVCPRGATPKSLGRYLGKVEGRQVGGFRIRLLPDKKRGASYRLEQAGADAAQQAQLSL